MTLHEQLQDEVEEIAIVLLRDKPPNTRMIEVWQEALSLHRVRYETRILPDPGKAQESRRRSK